MKHLFYIFLYSVIICANISATTEFIINKADVEKKHAKSFDGVIKLSNYTYEKKLEYTIFASNDCEKWLKLNYKDIVKQGSSSKITITDENKKNLKMTKRKYSDYRYFKFCFESLEKVDYISNIFMGNLIVKVRTEGDLDAEIPKISTKGTTVINIAKIEKDKDLFPDDEIQLLNKDSDHIKKSVELKVYCNKGDKWVYLGCLNADEDSSDEFEVGDRYVDLVNATYLALVPVRYEENITKHNGFFIGDFYYGETRNSIYRYYTPVGCINVDLDGNDIVLNFTAITDKDGTELIDEI